MVLSATGLRRRFGKVTAVDGLDLTVRAGEVYGFLGVNGAGKTTTIRMLMGIIARDAGALELFGEPTERTTLEQKRRIGYVSQEQNFYPWMTCAGLGKFVGGFYPTWDAEEFARLLRIFLLPPERKASELSGGMRLKLALALALAHRPELLIFDEPTAGLDPVARREFLDLVQAHGREAGRAMLFSSHLIDEVQRLAGRVGILHAGRMRYEGSLSDLLASVRRVRVRAPTTRGDLMQWARSRRGAAVGGSSGTAGPTQPAFPTGARVLQEKQGAAGREWVVMAPPAAWNSDICNSAVVEAMSLEDIFISVVGAEPVAA